MTVHRSWTAVLAGLGALALTALPAQAQSELASGKCCPPSCIILPYQPPTTHSEQGKNAGAPGAALAEQHPMAPDQQQQQDAERSGALGSESVALADSNVGYIDSAIPRTQVKLQFDSAWGANRPDRAEFFYAKCGCFNMFGIPAAGPPGLTTNVDYQELTSYIEWAPAQRFSAFLELPWRFVNPTGDGVAPTNGFGDIRAGVKGAFLYSEDQVATLQLRAFAPSGEPTRALGTDHYTLEPALLYYRKLADRLYSESEFRIWVPIGGSDFSGEVIRYGTGLSYLLVDAPRWQASPVAELVGWTVLRGQELAPTPPGIVPIAAAAQQAGGETIGNLKLGTRFGIGARQEGPGASTTKADLYVGYGMALTGTVWYSDIFRVEYRLRF